jgi:hypothetical protein
VVETRPEALQSLNLAGKHLQDIEYVSGHFMANGQDVIEDMIIAGMHNTSKAAAAAADTSKLWSECKCDDDS